MTGRDYKNLVKLHRETKLNEDIQNENFKNLSKVIDNFPRIKKYQPVNYDLLKNFIQERKKDADESLKKVVHLEDDNKLKKDNLFMKHHSIVWLKEWSRLLNQSKTIELELDNFSKLFKSNSVDYVNINENDFDTNIENDHDDFNDLFDDLNIIDELEQFDQNLKEEFIKFKVKTIHPIQFLKEDLEFYLKNSSIKKTAEQNDQILATIKSVKSQQQNVLNKLEQDYELLSTEMNNLLEDINQNELYVPLGIPQKAYELESPDEELKISVLNEFLIIDFKYQEKLDQLNETHLSIKNKLDGWSQSDHDIFQHIYEHYNFHNINLNNCNFTLRDLMFDRMKRTFLLIKNKKFDRTELVKHEDWCNLYKYYQQQQKLIINEWNESKKSLLLKAEAIFYEAYQLIEKDRIKKEEKEKQLKICNELYEKVTRWRNQKLEALEIQQKIDDMIKREQAEKLRMQKERENKRRELEKKAISDYNTRMEENKKRVEQEEQARLENLKKLLNEQAKKDKTRIELRNKSILDKKAELNNQLMNKKLEIEQKEKRLEKFYESVKPKVESDPARLVSFTQAEYSRRGVQKNSENDKFLDQKPLFNNNGFTDKQLNSDARLRIEERLRQAGLINNDYARALLKNTNSNSLVKRDLKTNSFWDGFSMNNN